MDFDGIVEIIKGAKSVRLSILTQQNKADGGAKKDQRNLESKPEDDAIFKTLRGEEKVDYVVQKRFLQQKLEEKARLLSLPIFVKTLHGSAYSRCTLVVRFPDKYRSCPILPEMVKFCLKISLFK